MLKMMTMIEDWAAPNVSFTSQYPPSQDVGDRDLNYSFAVYGVPYGSAGVGSEEPIFGEIQNTSQYFNSNETGNDTSAYFDFPFGDEERPIFDRSEVRAIFLVLYTIVFCSCFFGNLMVILVVTLHWRMRSITNFCLANLAFADLCVGIFCVYQNIIQYLMESWVFGEFMCKMYHFINSLSTTASVLILVVICIERYLAIIHPMTCKQMLTLGRLRFTIVLVWILSAVISSPRFYYFSLLKMPLSNGEDEILCYPNRTKYDSKLFDMISMTVLFLIPLGIISILYTVIGIVLWKTSSTKMSAASASVESSSSSGCYYRENDTNLIQTVNLTLLPVNGVQPSQLQANRPTTLHGIPNASISTTLNTEGLHHRKDKKSFALSSTFPCVNCGKKTKKQRQRNQKRNEMRGNISNNISNRLGNNSNNPAANEQARMDGNIIPCVCHCHNNPPDGQDYQNSHSHSTETTSFTHCPHHNHQVNNEDCVGFRNHLTKLETDDGQQEKHENAERSDSPITTTCCGGVGRSRCLNTLRKHGPNSSKKSVTFSTPPSPFCNRNCSCLDGKSSKTDPIILVKFEKKQNSYKKGRRRSQCTILMNTKNMRTTTNGCKCDGEIGAENTPTSNSLETGTMPTRLCNGTKFSCANCHAPHVPADNEYGADEGNGSLISGNVSNTSGPIGTNGGGRFSRNFSFEQTRDNMSVDSGISGMRPGGVRPGSCCDQNFDSYSVGPAPTLQVESAPPLQQICQCQCSCEVATEPSYHHQLKYGGSNASPLKPTNLTSNGPTKRMRRLRIVKSSKYGDAALVSRRRIVRMLIVVVLAFALCHLPFHARKVWQYWSPPWAPYQAGSVFSQVFTPFTFLIMYVNSGINPILYAFMSKKFRMSFRDLLCCRMRHSLRISRNASVRSTHAVALSQTGC
ncbi:unnamed protein product [Orchesella dallaii]|uniref:G-protein coupled receptors family 1 profile domain-containing protein n=1 Tax=Orchesella dallaii TaxID=48710 RepID=A0ABP1PNH0_9HEXA